MDKLLLWGDEVKKAYDLATIHCMINTVIDGAVASVGETLHREVIPIKDNIRVLKAKSAEAVQILRRIESALHSGTHNSGDSTPSSGSKGVRGVVQFVYSGTATDI